MATKKKTSTRTARSAKASGVSRNVAQKSQRSKAQNTTIIALAAAILFMSVGFAAYATTLQIGGTGASNVTVKKAAWDIHWAQKPGTEETGAPTVTKGSSLTNTIERASDTKVNFSVTLQKP